MDSYSTRIVNTTKSHRPLPLVAERSERSNMEKIPQTERVLRYLKQHHIINPLKAWSKCGVYRLSDVIYKLRKQGYDIETEDVIVKNQFGEKCRVAQYRLWA